MNDEVSSPDKKAPVATSAVAPQTTSTKDVSSSQPVKDFEGKGLAGVVKKLSEEKLEDKAKRIADKLEKNPDKNDKTVEKEKKTSAKSSKEDKPATKKTATKTAVKKVAKK